MTTSRSRSRAWLVGVAVGAGATLGLVGVANVALAITSPSTSSTPASTPAGAAGNATGRPDRPDQATAPNGPGETVLTGDTAEKVKAAALAAVPGATVIRVETDSDGSPYEAHLTKADGTEVTVKVDANFAATDTIDGYGGHGRGGHCDGDGDGAAATPGSGMQGFAGDGPRGRHGRGFGHHGGDDWTSGLLPDVSSAA